MRPRINIIPHHTALVTPATLSPVSLEEAKTYLRVDYNDDDQLLMEAINQATYELEVATSRSFLNATYKDVYDRWPLASAYSACVHRNPLSSVTSITYTDSNGDSQTWSSSNYVVDNTSEPGRIALAENATLPLLDDTDNNVTVTYVAGYGTATTSVPVLAKHYIYLWINAANCRRPLTADEERALRSIETSLSYGL